MNGRFLRCGFVGLCVWAASLPAAGALVRIELPAATEVSGRSVALGQVAYITSTDLDLLRRLLALPLGTAPTHDAAVTLDRAHLSRWLRARAGLGFHDVEWIGEKQVAISRATQPVAPAELVTVAQNALSDWLGQRSERFEIRPVTEPRSLVVPQGAFRLAVRPLPDSQPSRRMQVWVEIWNHKEAMRSVPIMFDVKAHATAAMATRDLAPGSSAGGSITDEEVDLTAWPTRSKPMKAADVSALDAPRLRRPLRAGDIVTTSDVEATPAVQRGDWATVRMVDGALALESKVEVLHDAWIGQNVRVRAAQAESPVLARVKGRGQLEFNP